MRPTMMVILALSLCGLSSCDESIDRSGVDEVDGPGGKGDDLDEDADPHAGFHFVADSEFTAFRDHAGAPLLATIWGRISEYNADAPFVETSADGLKPWLLHITKKFHEVHASWTPTFEEMGLDACDDLGANDDIFADFGNGKLDLGNLEPEQCFGQEIRWPNRDKDFKLEDYRRTIEVSLPDYLTIELGQSPGFPNGRVLHEQINSLMFAMAFLDQGGECLRQDGSEEECNIYTLWNRTDFLKQFNDVPFRGANRVDEPARTFPWLADPHEM